MYLHLIYVQAYLFFRGLLCTKEQQQRRYVPELIVLGFLDKHFGKYIDIIHAYCFYIVVVLWCKGGGCFGNSLLYQSEVACTHITQIFPL